MCEGTLAFAQSSSFGACAHKGGRGSLEWIRDRWIQKPSCEDRGRIENREGPTRSCAAYVRRLRDCGALRETPRFVLPMVNPPRSGARGQIDKLSRASASPVRVCHQQRPCHLPARSARLPACCW